MRKLLPYKEGDLFCVPLRTNGYAIGIIARVANTGKILLGYFFGPKRIQISNQVDEEMCKLRPEDAILIGLFGDLGIINKEWPIIGGFTNWNSNKWPMPPFSQIDPISGENKLYVISEYDLYTIEKVIKFSNNVDNSCLIAYPDHCLMGYGAVEIRLTKLLQEK